MGLFDSLISPAAVGGAFAQGMQTGRAEREEREVKGALSAYALNPDDPQAFQTLAQYKPELAIRVREDQTKRTRDARIQALTASAAQGDKAAAAQLAGIDFDKWDKLQDNQRQAIKGQVDYVGNAALQISRLPADQRPAAWDQAIEEGVRLGYPGLAEHRGRYSEQGLQAAIANAGQVKQFIDMTEPKQFNVESGAGRYERNPVTGEITTVIAPNPGDKQPFTPVASSEIPRVSGKADYNNLKPGQQYMDPTGTLRTKTGGPTPQASGTFRPVGLPGETVTSTYRSPAHNAKVGGVSNSYHTRRGLDGKPLARDSVPPRGMSMAAYASRLRRLNPHMDVINEGDHVHLEPKG